MRYKGKACKIVGEKEEFLQRIVWTKRIFLRTVKKRPLIVPNRASFPIFEIETEVFIYVIAPYAEN